MAHLRKVGSGYQLQYYLNGQKRVKQFPKGTPKAVVEAECKRIESELALHKAGLKRFGEDPRVAEFLTVAELTEQVLNSREHEVTRETIARNRHAMKLFIAAIGKQTLVSEIKPLHFDQFRNARFEAMKQLHQKHGRAWNEGRVRNGLRKDLENIGTVFRLAVKKGLLPQHYLPKIEKPKVDRRRLPTFLNKQEVQDMAAQLSGEAAFAFWIIRYTPPGAVKSRASSSGMSVASSGRILIGRATRFGSTPRRKNGWCPCTQDYVSCSRQERMRLVTKLFPKLMSLV